MELGNFIHDEQSVWDTKICVGDWYVVTAYQGPAIPFQVADVGESEDGRVHMVVPEPIGDREFPMSRSTNAFKLDSDYTEDQLRCLQERALKEYDAWLVQKRNSELHETLRSSLLDFD